MPIIVHRYDGDNKLVGYDLEDKGRRRALKTYITRMANIDCDTAAKRQAKIIKLKFILLKTHQAAKTVGKLGDDNVTAIKAHVIKKLGTLGVVLAPADLNIVPETLLIGVKPEVSRALGDKVKRDITSYDENRTSALCVPDHIPKPAKDSLDHASSIIAMVASRQAGIIEHAARRTELFWLLCVAYYKSGYVVNGNQGALVQHGKATPGYGNAACHSSLISNVTDNSGRGRSLITGTPLDAEINSTVELPIAVNKVDSNMESEGKVADTMRYQANGILNRVSAGEICPLLAMSLYFKAMNDYFESAPTDFALKADREAPTDAKHLILEYQKAGTLSWAAKLKVSGTWSLSIATMMLWLKPKERQGSDSYKSAAVRLFHEPAYREECLEALKSEILVAPVA
ncbi:MAG: hypothetical protein P1U34_10730 [Coxiellaceae bacterium]|nr:hypothetical protein [Coxiellaceae bacterium]